eukprot:2360726-Rhodomonas_salina.5
MPTWNVTPPHRDRDTVTARYVSLACTLMCLLLLALSHDVIGPGSRARLAYPCRGNVNGSKLRFNRTRAGQPEWLGPAPALQVEGPVPVTMGMPVVGDGIPASPLRVSVAHAGQST